MLGVGKIKGVLGVFALAIIWSPTFLLVRLGVEHMPPATFTMIRCVMGGGTLLAFAVVMRSKIRPLFKMWFPLLVAGVLMNALPHALCAKGECYVDSSTAAIMEGSVPMFLLLFAYVFLKAKEMSRREIFGVAMGFLGLVIIFAPSVAKSPHEGLGLVLLMLMAASFAGGILFSSRRLKDIDPLPAVGLQMSLSSFALVPFALWFDRPWEMAIPPMRVLVLLFVLAVICSAAGWVLYYYLIRTVKASAVSLSTLLVPIMALGWGVFLMNEPVTWYKVLGGVITLLSVALTLQASTQPDVPSVEVEDLSASSQREDRIDRE